MSEFIALSDIKLDPSAQPRERIDDATVDEYAECMRRGDPFPPLTVFRQGDDLWLADGFHRYHAARKAGFEQIDCAVRPGDLRGATLFGLGANTKHGLRLSIADKRRGAMKLLQDDEWRRMSDGEIAKHVGVSDRFVAKLRRELAVYTPNVRSVERKFIHPKTGALTTMHTGKIGRQKAQSKKPATTEASIDRGERAIVVPSAKHPPSGHEGLPNGTHLYAVILILAPSRLSEVRRRDSVLGYVLRLTPVIQAAREDPGGPDSGTARGLHRSHRARRAIESTRGFRQAELRCCWLAPSICVVDES